MRKRPKSRRRGAAAVELALTLPIFLVVLTGIVEFGRAMMVDQLLTSAARRGVRRAIIDGATNSEVEQLVKSYCAQTIGVSQNNIAVNLDVTSAEDQSALANLSDAQMYDICQVSVSVPFNKVSYIVPNWLNQRQLVGTCTMEHE